MTRRLGSAIIALVCAGLLWAPPAIAAPANDNLALAQAIEGTSTTLPGSNFGATRETGEPFHGETGGASVWFAWEAPADGVVALDACTSFYGAMISVYHGPGYGQLVRAADSDSALCLSGGFGPRSEFDAVAGRRYLIAVDGDRSGGSTPAQGSFTLRLNLLEPPPHDMFANATPIEGTDLDFYDDNYGATKETGEYFSQFTSVWYRWVAPEDATVVANTCIADGYTWDREFSVFEAHDWPGSTNLPIRGVAGGECQVRFHADAGETYWFVVSADGNSWTGTFRFRLNTLVPPPNDEFEDAEPIAGENPVVHGNTANASGSDGSIWYRWTAPRTGTAILDTCGSAAPSRATAYTGTDESQLTQAGGGMLDSCQRRAPVQAGASYAIKVASGGSTPTYGPTVLAITIVDAPQNDLFANPQVLTGLDTTVTGTNQGATTEAREFNAGPGGASVWYSWTAPVKAVVTVDTCASDFDTLLAVYGGQSLEDPAPYMGQSDNDCGTLQSRVTFPAAAGATYRIAVDGDSWSGAPEQGAVVLHLLAVPVAPDNDSFSAATQLTGVSAGATESNLAATKQFGEPLHGGDPGGASLWYRWTASANGTVVAHTCGGEIPSVLGVYRGASVGSLQVAARGRDAECANGQAVRLPVLSGQELHFAVDGKSVAGSPARGVTKLVLQLRPQAAPQDALGAAQPLSGSAVQFDAPNLDATKQDFEPDHAGTIGGASIWARWTAPSPAPVVMETCGSDFDTVLAAYTATDSNPSVWNLEEVAAASDGCGAQARMSFTPVAGETYYVAVDGAGGPLDPAQGTARLRIEQPSPGGKPDPVSERPPAIQISGVTVNRKKRRATIRFTVSGSPGGFAECAVDKGAFARCGSPLVVKRLAKGRHQVRIVGVAPGGVRGPVASRTFKR